MQRQNSLFTPTDIAPMDPIDRYVDHQITPLSKQQPSLYDGQYPNAAFMEQGAEIGGFHGDGFQDLGFGIGGCDADAMTIDPRRNYQMPAHVRSQDGLSTSYSNQQKGDYTMRVEWKPVLVPAHLAHHFVQLPTSTALNLSQPFSSFQYSPHELQNTAPQSSKDQSPASDEMKADEVPTAIENGVDELALTECCSTNTATADVTVQPAIKEQHEPIRVLTTEEKPISKPKTRSRNKVAEEDKEQPRAPTSSSKKPAPEPENGAPAALSAGKKPPTKADPLLKKILRAFRKLIKDEFLRQYGSKYFHWDSKHSKLSSKAKLQNKKKREGEDVDSDRYVFTTTDDLKAADGIQTQGYQFAKDFYKKNESFLYSLIHNTKNEQFELLTEVFGQKPNRSNLEQFFKHEAIQALWWGPSDPAVGNVNKRGFIDSEKFDEVWKSATADEREKVANLLGKVAPTGLEIIYKL